MNHHALVLGCCLLAGGGFLRGAEPTVPKTLQPLAFLLGHWTGQVESTTIVANRKTTVRYPKTTTVRLGADGQSLEMKDVDSPPGTAEPVVTRAVIRYDAASRKYKALVWDTQGTARLFVLRVQGKAIHFTQCDTGNGVTLTSTVTLHSDGTLNETGAQRVSGDQPWRMEWTIHYTRSAASAPPPPPTRTDR